MDFKDFSNKISKIKNLELPGQVSHDKMTPSFRRQELASLKNGAREAQKAAVMALFYPNARQETYFLLILRNTYPGVHSNQVGLPGGKLEKGDCDLVHTAVRETYEEVGALPEGIEVVRSLTKIYIPPSNFEVTPFVGLYNKKQPFVPQIGEVAALIEVPLTDLLDDSRVFNPVLDTSYSKKVTVPAFKLNDYTVWGATAMMLSEIKELLKRIL